MKFMGTDYTIYTEIYIKDKWYGADSYILTPEGNYKLSPLLCGRSYVGEFLDNLGSSRTIKFSDLAETTQKYMYEITFEEYRDQLPSETFEVYDYYTEIKSKFVREYQYEYYVPRYSVVAFETGEIEEIGNWLTRDSYDELPTEEQKEYVFFKWNEPYGWYKTLADVITRVEMRIEDFRKEISFSDGMWEYLQQINLVRLIVAAN